MRLTFHALWITDILPTLESWQQACRDLGFSVVLANDNPLLSRKTSTLSYTWRGLLGHVDCYLAEPSDVADIFDDWSADIRDNYRSAVSFDYQGDEAAMPGALVLAVALTQLGDGALVIESDGVFLKTAEALATAKRWEQEQQLNN
jgi:hypothetical protein